MAGCRDRGVREGTRIAVTLRGLSEGMVLRAPVHAGRSRRNRWPWGCGYCYAMWEMPAEKYLRGRAAFLDSGPLGDLPSTVQVSLDRAHLIPTPGLP